MLASTVLLLILAVPACAAEPTYASEGNRPLPLEILSTGVDEVHLEPVPAGEEGGEDCYGYRYRVEYRDGRVEHLSPHRFAELLYTQYSGRTRLFALLNITSAVASPGSPSAS